MTSYKGISIKRAFLLMVCFKLMIFFYFIFQRDPNWNPSLVKGWMALAQLDTNWYFEPLESVVKGGHYDSVCKLPGFAPIYLPLRIFMDQTAVYNVICLLQVICDAWSAVLLALLALGFFKSIGVYHLVLVGYGLSTFVSIRSNYVLSDSFCTSFLIIGCYCLFKGTETQLKRWFFISGLCLLWSFEMRPVVLVVYPVVLMIIGFSSRSSKKFIFQVLLIISPLILASWAWLQHNQLVHQRNLVLIAPVEECMTHFGPEASAIRRFVIAIGHDFQPWSSGSAAEWFLKRGVELPHNNPFNKDDFAPTYNLDTLVQIRTDYKKIEQGICFSSSCSENLIVRMNRCTEQYISAHSWDYYVKNRFGFIGSFLFPTRIDDLPLPPFDRMNWGHKVIKMASLSLLWLVHLFGILGVLLSIKRFGTNMLLWSGIGISGIVVLALQGFIEQRYLTISYPFSLIFACLAVHRIYLGMSKKMEVKVVDGTK